MGSPLMNFETGEESLANYMYNNSIVIRDCSVSHVVGKMIG